MMLGLQGNASSSKVYRCVACSATFTGLASLLVHQATHASALAKVSAPPPQSHISPHETLSSSPDLSSEHRSPRTVLPESPSPSFYICDCGEEFQDFNLMLEHKRSHVSQIQLLQSMGDNMISSGAGIEKMFPTKHVPLTPAVNQSALVLSCPSTSKPLAVELPTLTDHKADVSLGDGTAIVTTPQDLCKPSQDEGENHDNMSATAEQITEREEEINSQDITESVLSNEKGESLPKNNSLMKLLASAYMKRLIPRPSQNQNDSTVTPKQEVYPVDITPGAKPEVPAVKDLSITQLRRLLVKPGIKTKAPPISRILESSKKKIVSLTKTFSPVVVLETRQKLMDPIGNGTYGSYQCGRCRRVFQSLDRLTEHHLLHKKERIKCCRRCKQLIIGRLPLPDNHVCPQLANKAKQSSSSLRSNLPFSQKVMPFHSYGNTKKIFFCPLCKHSYARRWNLKTHKCQGPRSAFSLQDSRPVQKMFVLKSNSNGQINAVGAESQSAKSIAVNTAVNTELTSHIKVEATSITSEQSAVPQLRWTTPAKSFLPFYPKSSSVVQDKDASPSRISHQQGDENSWNAAAENHDGSSEGKWVMPLDDQMELQISAENADDDVDIDDDGGGEVSKSVDHALHGGEVSKSVDHAETTPPGLHYYVRDGVKRYPCNRCQKTYSRPCTLRRHLRLCGFRPRGLSTLTQGQDASPLNANNLKPMFACFVCGKQFNRKDNMMTHRKRCQLQRTMSDVNGGMVQQSLTGKAADCPTQEDEGSNWGIMSLPSVLPRRVTCECGVGFTSPRLLLEHLQKHAQESYTCPTCGETVSSWADYEVHLQIHMHPHHLLLKGIQPQRSQPLLLRFQQQPSPPQPPADVHQLPQNQPPQNQLPQKQPHPEQIINPVKKQQRIVCTRCGNTFATRCSLRKHISWNRCKGGRVVTPPTNLPKTYHCSHCNSDFPNTISLLFHQRSGACKPTIKPARCPVCLRWFGTMVGLQKHLLTHKQSESYRCDACQGTYSNLKSLQNHRRRIHRILVGGSKPVTQEPLTS